MFAVKPLYHELHEPVCLKIVRQQ